MENNNMDRNDDLEKLRMENELKKMKLILQHGAVFSDPEGGKKIDPLLENEFLKSVEAFESSYQDAEQVLVYDIIERPDFIPIEELRDEQIHDELDRMMSILNKNGIQLDTICEVEEKEIYRFITEELFVHKIDNMQIPGMTTHFIYEEFHPNHEYDIRDHSINGIRSFLNKKTDFYSSYFTREAEADTGLTNFRNAFKSFSIKHLEITHLNFDEETAFVRFDIDFTGKIEGSNEKERFAGEGSVKLLYKYDYWCIQKITFPHAIVC